MFVAAHMRSWDESTWVVMKWAAIIGVALALLVCYDGFADTHQREWTILWTALLFLAYVFHMTTSHTFELMSPLPPPPPPPPSPLPPSPFPPPPLLPPPEPPPAAPPWCSVGGGSTGVCGDQECRQLSVGGNQYAACFCAAPLNMWARGRPANCGTGCVLGVTDACGGHATERRQHCARREHK